MKKYVVKFLSLFMLLFPWITYFHFVQYSDAEKAIYGGANGFNLDFFIYGKEIVLIIVAAVMLLWFLLEQFLFGKEKKSHVFCAENKWLFVLMGLFLVGTVISTVLAEQPQNAFWGSHEIGEGLWTLIAYLIVILVFYNYFASDDALGWVRRAIIILSGVTGILSFVEWFYKPLLEIELIQKLVAPAQYAGIMSTLKADRFADAISLTFYNPGYYGGFVCILVPFMLAFYLHAKNTKQKLINGIILCGVLFGVIASESTTALYVAIFEVVSLLAIYIIFAKDKKKAGVQGSIALVITMTAFITFGAVTGNYVINLASNANSFTGDYWWWNFQITDIKMEGNSIQLVGTEKTLGIYYENGKFVFRNENGETLETVRSEEGVTFTEKGFEGLRVSAVDVSHQVEGARRCVSIYAGYLEPIEFFLLNDGTFAGIGQGGKIIKDIGDAGTPDELKKYYGMLTGRGYIWSNTLPILKETLLIGKGPGNFAFHFKHFDYMGILATYRTTGRVITKPHNAFLQYATELGVPAAIAFFGIFIGVLIKSALVFWKNKDQRKGTECSIIHVASAVMLAGFLVYSMINDSMVTVTPIVCMLTGVLLACSHVMEHNK